MREKFEDIFSILFSFLKPNTAKATVWWQFLCKFPTYDFLLLTFAINAYNFFFFLLLCMVWLPYISYEIQDVNLSWLQQSKHFDMMMKKSTKREMKMEKKILNYFFCFEYYDISWSGLNAKMTKDKMFDNLNFKHQLFFEFKIFLKI